VNSQQAAAINVGLRGTESSKLNHIRIEQATYKSTLATCQ